MTKIELTLDVERDLIDIYLYGIEHFGHAQAERYAEILNGKITEVVLVFRPVLCRAALWHGFHITRQVSCLVFD